MSSHRPSALSSLQDPVAALRHILPPHAQVGGGLIGLLQRPLPAQERTTLLRARGGRIADFTAGRSAARDAFGELGLFNVVLPRGKRGPPIWPEGYTGSISHANGWALAVCAPLTACATLGIDIEALTTDLDLAMIATQAERAQEIDHLAARIFSAKEAVYKAQFPLTGRMLDFPDVEITFHGSRRSYSRDAGALLITPFTARILPLLPNLSADTPLEGMQVIALDLVITLVSLPPDLLAEGQAAQNTQLPTWQKRLIALCHGIRGG